jgi:archaellum biogenesis ATPase FlaH
VGWTIKDVLADEGERKLKTLKKPQNDLSVQAEESDAALKDRTLPTGLHLLDKNLDGGFPRGSFVCIYADPAASPEAFLYQFSTERKTYYINTSRPISAIRKDFSMLSLEDTLVSFIDVYTFYFKELSKADVNKRTMNFILKEIQLLKDREMNVVIDNLTFFLNLRVENSLKEIFLNTLYKIPKECDGLLFAYVIKDSLDSKLLKRIFDLSDVIMEIFIETTGSRYVKRFGIPKIRGRTPLNDLFKFDIGEGVHLDTSKDIA